MVTHCAVWGVCGTGRDVHERGQKLLGRCIGILDPATETYDLGTVVASRADEVSKQCLNAELIPTFGLWCFSLSIQNPAFHVDDLGRVFRLYARETLIIYR